MAYLLEVPESDVDTRGEGNHQAEAVVLSGLSSLWDFRGSSQVLEGQTECGFSSG